MDSINLRSYSITQRFGEYGDVYTRLGLLGHPGIDMGANFDNVWSETDGSVSFCGDSGNYGLLVIIIDKSGNSWYYAHLSQLHVSVNQNVTRGQVIAISGNSGLSSGPHLHLEVRPASLDKNNGYGGAIEPLLILEGDIEVSATEDFVTKVYLAVLGRQPDPGGLGHYVGQPTDQVFNAIFDSEEAISYRQRIDSLSSQVAELTDRVNTLSKLTSELQSRPTKIAYDELTEQLQNLQIQLDKQKATTNNNQSLMIIE